MIWMIKPVVFRHNRPKKFNMPSNHSVTESGIPKRELNSFRFTYSQIIWLYFGSLDALIALRIGLKLFGANPENPMVALIYGFTALFVITGWISSPTVGTMVLELASVFAILIYTLLAWSMERTLWLLSSRPRQPVAGVPDNPISEHPVFPSAKPEPLD